MSTASSAAETGVGALRPAAHTAALGGTEHHPANGVAHPHRGGLRVLLYTDTLGDVNGVSRFIRDVAGQAEAFGHALRVVTSTRFECPDRPNIVNVTPPFAWRMPKYEHLEIVAPPWGRLIHEAVRFRPHVVHLSTPGPVGVAGLRAARRLRVPVLGVYHTDFPAYVEHLFNDRALTWLMSGAMRAFYAPFARIFTRSADYAESLVHLGIPRRKLERLRPGIDTSAFHPGFRDLAVWDRFGLSRTSVKVLYVGRVSVEKDLPFLSRVWRPVSAALASRGVEADLVIIGDGPYRPRMQEELRGRRAHFLGFRYGEELATLYAGCDLFAFTSTTDTLGQVVMESQASGLPVLVTDEGGPKEVVDHGTCGLVLPAGNARAWIEALTALVADGERRRRMGAAAYEAMQAMSIRASFEHFWAVHEAAHAELSRR